MSVSEPPPNGAQDRKPIPPGVPVQRMLMVGGEVGGVTLLIVLGAVFGGIWLDRVIGTGWIFTITLVVLSAPLSLVLTFWLAMRAVRDLNPPSQGGPSTQGGAKSGGTSPQTKIQDEEGGNDW